MKDTGGFMETLLLIISVLIVVIVLLQSNKATDSGQIISGGNDSLFQNRKERGAELLITRVTTILGILFIVVSFIIYVK